MIHILALGAALLGSVSAGELRADAPSAGEAIRRAAAPQAPPVRIWVEEGTDVFYPGDRVGLRFRTADDAYVAVLHLDPDGNLELLFPASAWDDEFVRGGRTYSVPARGAASRFALGRTPGIGYFYVIASPYPLDFRFFRSHGGWASDAWGLVLPVRGDPFWALDRITLILLGERRVPYYAADVYSYYLGGRHRYPGYACYDPFGRARGWGGYPYYPSCDRLQRLLLDHPYYYDTRRYRGDRVGYLRELDRIAPRHGFKEPVSAAPPVRRLEPQAAPAARPVDRTEPPTTRPQREAPRAEPATPSRQRPSLERRDRGQSAPPAATQPPPAREGTRPTPRRPAGRENDS